MLVTPVGVSKSNHCSSVATFTNVSNMEWLLNKVPGSAGNPDNGSSGFVSGASWTTTQWEASSANELTGSSGVYVHFRWLFSCSEFTGLLGPAVPGLFQMSRTGWPFSCSASDVHQLPLPLASIVR